MQNLITDIKNIIPVDDSLLEKIHHFFKIKSFNKNEILPTFNKVCESMMFISSGLLRVYNIDNNGKEITIQLGIEGMWVNDLYSYLTQTPSKNRIHILAPTRVLQIHKQDLEQLCLDFQAMAHFVLKKTQQTYIKLQDRTLNQLNTSAEERYLHFKDRYGQIENRVPQYMIASYLNITPEHLSKVKTNLLKK